MKITLGRRPRSTPPKAAAPEADERSGSTRGPGARAHSGRSLGARRAQRPRLVIGCMTGTSLDGLDAALVAVHGHALAMRAEYRRGISVPLGALAGPLRRLAEQEAMTARDITHAMADLAAVHIRAVRELAETHLDLIVVHGQTVFHAPPLSWQLCNPVPIAAALQVPVVHDLRAADLACGGQGAPITPLADYILFRHGAESRAIINLGGFCNLTLLPAGNDATRIAGRDVCACNQLLDAIARTLWGLPFDHHGQRALTGRVDRKALTSLLPTLALQAASRRSLGTGDEVGAWIERWRTRASAEDLARTACAAIAQTIVRATTSGPALARLVVAGGGVRNRALLAELTQRASLPVVSSEQLTVPIDMREAIAMAILGTLCLDQVPITVGAVTGVETPPIAGVWTFPTRRPSLPRAASGLSEPR